MTKSSASCCSGLEPEPLVVLVVAIAVVTGGVPAVAIVRILPGADPTGDDDPGNPAKKQSKKNYDLCQTYAWLNYVGHDIVSPN